MNWIVGMISVVLLAKESKTINKRKEENSREVVVGEEGQRSLNKQQLSSQNESRDRRTA